MIQEKDLYNLISGDSMSWLDNSEKLKFSADIIQKELQILIDHFQRDELDFNNEDKVQALWNSYYLIIGLAFENLIKGLSIENNRSLKNFDEIFNTLWKHNSGHGISKIAKDNITDLTDEEIDFFEKLEIYILWAGRYPLPKNIDIFVKDKNKLVFDTNDYEKIDNLFCRIKDLLVHKWEDNGYK